MRRVGGKGVFTNWMFRFAIPWTRYTSISGLRPEHGNLASPGQWGKNGQNSILSMPRAIFPISRARPIKTRGNAAFRGWGVARGLEGVTTGKKEGTSFKNGSRNWSAIVTALGTSRPGRTWVSGPKLDKIAPKIGSKIGLACKIGKNVEKLGFSGF